MDAPRDALPDGKRSLSDALILAGVAAGAIFGMAGTLVGQASLRQIFWGIDGIGLIVATTLLAVRYIRQGNELVGGGFIVFALGESLLVGGLAAGLEGGQPFFGGGVALWAAALSLTSIPPVFAGWARATGAVGAVLFFAVAFRIFGGEVVLPTESPLPFFAYPFLVLTTIGWAMAVAKTRP